MFNIENIKEEHKEILDKFYGIFPVPLTELAQALGYKVNYFTPDADTIKISGFVDYKSDKKIIGINSSDSEYRQRFTIAHEIGHILNGDDISNDFYIDYRDNIEGKNRDKKEVMANKVAAELLMPKIEFINKFEEFKKLGKSNTLIFMNLSLYFGASEEAIKIRADHLKLL